MVSGFQAVRRIFGKAVTHSEQILSTPGGGFSFYVAILFLALSPVLMQGHAISPHDNALELGVPKAEWGETVQSNRKFSDFSSVYIPEINQHFNGDHRQWLSTWSPWTEFGRPTFQLGGVGKANLIANLLSYLTHEPFVFYTLQTVLTVFLTGTFFFLFLRTLGLHPLACATAALGLAAGVFTFYWLTFNVFVSTFCWTLALYWFVSAFTRRPSVYSWVGLSFSSYSLLMTGYPQAIILNAYPLVGYTLVRLWSAAPRTSVRLKLAFLLGLGALTGVLAAAPAYLDVALAAERSARLSNDDTFFIAVLPTIQSLPELARYLALVVDAFWLGNPISPHFPVRFNGLSLTPVYFGLFLLSLGLTVRRRLWPWHLFVGFCLVATLWPAAYLFMVHNLGFHLSPSLPLGGALIPSFILCAHQADHVLRTTTVQGGLRNKRTMLAVLVVMALLAGAFLLSAGIMPRLLPRVRPHYLALAVALFFGVYVLIATRRLAVLAILIAITPFFYSKPLILARPLEQIHTSSALTKVIKRATADGTRFAFVGKDKGPVIPPNQESLIGARSVHAYDSLSSKDYQRHIVSLGGEVRVYGRHSRLLDADRPTAKPAFSLTGIGLVLSKHALPDPGLRQTSKVAGLRFYQPMRQPILYAQLTRYEHVADDRYVVPGYLHDNPSLPVRRVVHQDDFQRFKLTASAERTLLFVSQQYHPMWRVYSDTGPLAVVKVNDFYLGVIVPSEIRWVEFEFRPYVFWSFIPQILYGLVGGGLLLRWILARRKRARTRAR